MNPEDRDRINPAELQTAQQALASERTQYADTKRGVRDYNPIAGEQLDQSLTDYGNVRGTVIRMDARMQADNRPEAYGSIYREVMANVVSEDITREDLNLVRTELERGRQVPPYNLGHFYSRHPWARAAVGTSIAVGASLASATDILPWSLPLGVGIGVASWLGATGAISGTREFIQTRFGQRSRPDNIPALSLSETERRVAELQEHRVENGIEGSNHLEADLLTHREGLIRRSIDASLQASNTLWRTWTGDIVAEKLRQAYNSTGENLNQLKQEVLHRNRGHHRISWAAAGIFAVAVVFGASYLPIQEEAIKWQTPDYYYQATIGNGEVSSLHGDIQAIIATKVAKIANFDPTNDQDLEKFREYQTQYPVEYAKLVSAFERYAQRHGRVKTGSNGDLVEHQRDNDLPKDKDEFIDGVLGRNQSLLDSIRFVIYR